MSAWCKFTFLVHCALIIIYAVYDKNAAVTLVLYVAGQAF